jgi:hypothetical protein
MKTLAVCKSINLLAFNLEASTGCLHFTEISKSAPTGVKESKRLTDSFSHFTSSESAITSCVVVCVGQGTELPTFAKRFVAFASSLVIA